MAKKTKNAASAPKPSLSVAPTRTDAPPKGPRVREAGSILSVPILLAFILLPILSLLWTPEAPALPFSFVREAHGAAVAGVKLVQPRVLLVTARPGDELLVAPTALALLRGQGREEAASLWTVCLSSGDGGDVSAQFNGRPLGDLRKEEWRRSWNILGLAEGRRWILDVPALRDNSTIAWDARTIAEHVGPYVLEHDINAIITFEAAGLTHDLPRASLEAGVVHLLASPSFTADLKGRAPPRVFALKNASWRAQHGPLSPILEHLALSVRVLMRAMRAQQRAAQADAQSAGAGSAGGRDAPLEVPSTVFISDVRRYVAAWRALLQHESRLGPALLALGAVGKSLWVNEWVEVV